VILSTLDFQALPSIRETEGKEIEGAEHGGMKGRQRKRSMEGTNINSSVLISLSPTQKKEAN